MKTVVAFALALSVLLIPISAGAAPAVSTRTTAEVCCPGSPSGELENFGGYVFKGTVEPSRAGQLVRFSYKRPNADRWRPFKVAGEDGAQSGFYVLDKDRPADKLSADNRFRVEFTPSVRPGRWLIRAVFPSQGSYARSADVVRVDVAGSD